MTGSLNWSYRYVLYKIKINLNKIIDSLLSLTFLIFIITHTKFWIFITAILSIFHKHRTKHRIFQNFWYVWPYETYRTLYFYLIKLKFFLCFSVPVWHEVKRNEWNGHFTKIILKRVEFFIILYYKLVKS